MQGIGSLFRHHLSSSKQKERKRKINKYPTRAEQSKTEQSMKRREEGRQGKKRGRQQRI
jgi:hypothetical protein